jgi:zinc protease
VYIGGVTGLRRGRLASTIGNVSVAIVMNIPFVRHTLDNGLDVLVHEDRNCPIVAVNVWYHVGSKNEQPGRTGFAHLFEHLMFEGSQHYDRGYFHPLQQAGAALNGSTNADRTNYWEVVPSNALELALWMESDRMGYLLPALTDEKFENQRDVVLNERRQNYENRPYGLAGMAIVAALYPPDHPYHWLTIGEAADIRQAQAEEVRDFFRTYYRPRNASLSIAGDIAADEGLRLAEAYFGEIEAGDPPPAVAYRVPDPRAAETRLLLEDRVELPRLYLAWHAPALFGPGDAELDLVAEVLASGKTSRLYRALVFEQRLATEIAASQNSREIGSFFQIVATAAPGRTLVELEAAIAAEIATLVREGPTAIEMERCRAQAESQFVYRLQTVGGFGGKSDQLNAYNVFLRDPGYFDRDLARYRGASAAALQAAAAEWLRPDQRVVLSVVPRGRTALALDGSQPSRVS